MSQPAVPEALMATYARADLAFERGEGSWLITTGGERYLDCATGIAVNALGHAHPKLVAALTEQAQKLWHTSNLYRMPLGERLAQRLVEATFADRVFFANSGAETLEGAIKMVRRYQSGKGRTDRWRIITFEGAFHGRTLATLAAGGQAKYLEGFGPKVDGFDQVPFGDMEAVRKAVGPETAGILLEPIQGEGGIRAFSAQDLRAIRDLCDEQDLLLVFDEVQSGVGRTGRLYACELTGVMPDILTSAKGIGGGFPMGAILATQKACAAMTAGSHGSTFGGNPLAMAVGNAVLDVVLEEGFLETVRQKSLLLKQKLACIRDQFPSVLEDIRGEGLLLGLKCRVPNKEMIEALRAQHVLSVAAGDNVIRFLPPLNISEQDIDYAVAGLEKACAQVATAGSTA